MQIAYYPYSPKRILQSRAFDRRWAPKRRGVELPNRQSVHVMGRTLVLSLKVLTSLRSSSKRCSRSVRSSSSSFLYAERFNEQVRGLCDEVIVTEDHTEVGDTTPSAIFGTQMERHIGKRIFRHFISSPVHIQNGISTRSRTFLLCAVKELP